MRTEDIRIGKRFRQDLGDIQSLADSIADIGLLHPIVVDSENRLIVGRRRLAACELLGWTDIPATVLDLESIVRGERDENICRKDFTPSEAYAIGQALEPVERAAAKERQREHGNTAPGQISNTPENFTGVSLDRVAQAVGMSRPTYEKIGAVVESGDDDLIAEMDRTGKVTGPYREIKRRQDAERVATTQLPEGQYRTIVIDPPWDWSDEGDVSQMGRSKPTYATMPIDEVAALPIPDLAADDCHLYLWITNRSLPKGFKLINDWGFRYITMLTWCKPSIGIGNYFRNNTEHILFAVKGAQRLLRFDVGTWFAAPRGKEHSAKPPMAYEIIESCSPEPRIDMFARESHAGFISW